MKRIAVFGTGHSATGGQTPPDAIVAAAGEGFAPLLIEPRGTVFPKDEASRQQTTEAYVRAGVEAQRMGFDGIFINTVGDYGLAPLREKLHIPVMGSGEAALRAAASHGTPFAIVTIWPPSLRFIYETILEDANLAADCSEVFFLSKDEDLATLNAEHNFVTDMRACYAAPLNAIEAACRGAEARGAKAIMLGCTCMQPVAKRLRDRIAVPLIEPMVTGYLATEAACAAAAA